MVAKYKTDGEPIVVASVSKKFKINVNLEENLKIQFSSVHFSKGFGTHYSIAENW